jgi:hydroxybutyrate-dimer hydrolase
MTLPAPCIWGVAFLLAFPLYATAAENSNGVPQFLGTISSHYYDGKSDDLLTAGLGKTGLANKAPPVLANPAAPDAAGLRQLAIYSNYRALVDITEAGGYGLLYGPNIDIKGADTLGEGKIAGHEFIAYSDDGDGKQQVTMMVQVPDSFDPRHPCIITATSSGSRGVYGAIATAGEWGLKHGCAVAYNDKGTGNGVEDLQNQTVNLQDGQRASATDAGNKSNFTAQISPDQLAEFNTKYPNRFAIKHAHSQQNPETNWGKWTLQSIQFAFYELNQIYGGLAKDGVTHRVKFTPKNTITIASSVSNGAGAALAAAEQDTQGLISGVAVAEPQIQLQPNSALTVVRGSGETAIKMVGTGKSLLDYFTIANLMQPCAALVNPEKNAFNTINATIAANRCTSLKEAGLISGENTNEQASSALAALHSAGWQPESDRLHAAHYSFATMAVTLTYANSYGRFSATDNVCNYSYAGSSAKGEPGPVSAEALAAIFATGNGIPPTSGIVIINNASTGGPLVDAKSLSKEGAVADYNSQGALCLRKLVTGNDQQAQQTQAGITQVQHTANLHSIPTIIVHGRSDTLVPVALTSRPYFGMNQITEGKSGKLSYIEVTNAQHFDAFLGFPGFNANLIPLHRYFIEALDLMYAHLRRHTPLPPSQVVRTVPRGLNESGAVNPIKLENVPAIPLKPAARDLIRYANHLVSIPD